MKSISKNELNQTKLFDACYRTHLIVIHTYQFLRLLILNKYQTKSKRMGCINSDENTVNNMIKIVNIYLSNKTRPEKFKRDYILMVFMLKQPKVYAQTA